MSPFEVVPINTYKSKQKKGTVRSDSMHILGFHHYYILTKNPTAVMSDFRHFPVACTTLWFFFKRRKLVIG